MIIEGGTSESVVIPWRGLRSLGFNADGLRKLTKVLCSNPLAGIEVFGIKGMEVLGI